MKLKHGSGLGVRWFSPLAPFSFDIAYGHSDKKIRWHISLGTRFLNRYGRFRRHCSNHFETDIMTDTTPTDTDPTENGTRKMPSEHRPAPPAKKTPPAAEAVGGTAVCPDFGSMFPRLDRRYGSRFALRAVPNPVLVRRKHFLPKPQGTLLDGFDGDNWSIETEGADLKISRFRFAWKPSETDAPRLHITDISAGDIAIVTKPTPPKEERPPQGLPTA
ncbi:surface antigen family protein [Neisseria gonorrhoeae]|nr:surface antigen family protein [Neisseria gonorrhoeae]